MNLLILPEYPFPTNHVVVETVYEKLLPEHGHTIHMVRPSSDVSDVVVRLAPWTNGQLILFPHEPLGSARFNILRARRKRQWVKKSLEHLLPVTFDAVLVRNDLVSAQIAVAFARAKNTPFAFQVSSPDAEFRIRQGRQRGLAKGIYTLARGYSDLWRRRWLCRRADVVLPISDAMRHYMVHVEKIDSLRAFSFPMGITPWPLVPLAEIKALRDTLQLPAEGTIVYSGVLDAIRQPDRMLDIVACVRQRVPEAVLLILTPQTDERRTRFEARAAQLNVPVKIVGPLHHTQVGRYLQCADVAISPIPPIFEYCISSPTKSLEGMFAGLPVVGSSEIQEHADIFRESGGGLAIPFETNAFADAIVSLLSCSDRRRQMGEAGRRWVLSRRTYGKLTGYLETILQGASSVQSLAVLAHSPD